MYSQNLEQKVINDYYPSWFTGTVLDIGANDGKTLSNSLALIEKGWMGVLVEPDKNAYQKLWELHSGKQSNSVYMYNIAIGEHDGPETFYSTGDHLGKGDTGLLSTLDYVQLQRFPGEAAKANSYQVNVKTFASFYEECPFKNYDAITIDAEGMDLVILNQIDLKLTRTSLVCIEWNSKDEWVYDRALKNYGMKQIYKSGENLIYAL